MSNIYHTEPPTQGKVLIKTTSGDIDLELWPKEAPLACRNFIQLCLEGYYDGCLIHRVIKDFMLQTGDPQGDGSGGNSIWGRHFKDEIHGRIKFNHRGQVAMANENKPNTNLSQFFITLGPCDWLDRKHTIFGKVTGNTIYNVMRIGDVDVDEKEKPVDPIRIVSIDVLWNPFDDIVPRENQRKSQENSTKSEGGKKKERKATNNLNLLSFGDDEFEAESVVINAKMHSIHDSKLKDAKLSSEVAEEVQDVLATATVPAGDQDDRRRRRHSDQHRKSKSKPFTNSAAATEEHKSLDSTDRLADSSEDDEIEHNDADTISSKLKKRLTKANGDTQEAEFGSLSALVDSSSKSDRREEIEKKTREFARLREEMLRSKRAVKVLTGTDAEQLRKDTAFQELSTPLEQRRQKYAKRKFDHGDRQEETLKRLQQFTSSLKTVKAKAKVEAPPEANEKLQAKETEAYHGQVLEAGSDEEDAGDDESFKETWHVGALKFRKHIDDKYRAGTSGDGRFADDYAVIDSRDVSAEEFVSSSKRQSSRHDSSRHR